MKRKTLALVLGCALAAPAVADDVTDQLNEALNAYKSGNLENTIVALDAAATLVRQKRAAAFIEVLPKPLPGWVSEADDTTSAAGAAMFGGGVTAERSYREQKENDYRQVTLSVLGDSPMVQSMAMLFSNPMLMGGGGQKLVLIDGRKVIENAGEGSLSTLVNNKVLVTARGGSNEPATLEAVKSYFKAIDFKKLEGMVK